MFRTLNSNFTPKVICRYTHRYKDYKKVWKKEGILDDWQNLGNKLPTITEKWQSENNDVTDISRLPKLLQNRKSGIMKLSPPQELYETTIDYQRATYAFYGKCSSIDPGEVCWPSPEYLELINDREVNYENSFMEMMEIVKKEKQQKKAAIDEFQNKIEQNLALLPNMISAFKEKQAKTMKEAETKEKLRKDLIREAREYYGFTLDYNDPRMQKFKEMKALEAKKLQKEAKKKLKMLK